MSWKLILFGRIVIFSLCISIAYNIYLYIENLDLKVANDTYKDMIKDYSGNDIKIVDEAVKDYIFNKKQRKINE